MSTDKSNYNFAIVTRSQVIILREKMYNQQVNSIEINFQILSC